MSLVLRLLLSLTVALATVTFASARVQEAGLVDVVICSQGMERVLTLDPQGQPVERGHHCPDCLAALPMPVAADLPATAPLTARAVARDATGRAQMLLGLQALPPARGPPVMV